MGILAWIVTGLLAGALAKVIFPGPNGDSWFKTTILGIIGGLVGGFIGTKLLGSSGMTGFNPSSILHATGGSLVVLAIHHFIGKKKGGDGPKLKS